GFQGVGFAIPIDLAKPVVQQLRASGKVTRGWLGVSIQPITPELAKSFNLTETKGALVASVADGSPAAKAGLKPGDVILRYDGKAVEGSRALPALVANTEIGRTVEMSVVRDGSARPMKITVGNLAESRQASAAGEPARSGRVAERLGVELQQGDKGVV